jgi:hypothetical protein
VTAPANLEVASIFSEELLGGADLHDLPPAKLAGFLYLQTSIIHGSFCEFGFEWDPADYDVYRSFRTRLASFKCFPLLRPWLGPEPWTAEQVEELLKVHRVTQVLSPS